MPKSMTPETETAQVKPNPELEKRTRRVFSAEYKLRIIQQADACAHGEVGALLRREKLYYNQLQQWRREFAEVWCGVAVKVSPRPQSQAHARAKTHHRA